MGTSGGKWGFPIASSKQKEQKTEETGGLRTFARAFMGSSNRDSGPFDFGDKASSSFGGTLNVFGENSSATGAYKAPSHLIGNPFRQEGTSDNIFRRLNDQFGGYPPPPDGIFSESSDEDREAGGDDQGEGGKDGFITQHLKNMRGIMKIIKDQKQKLENGMDF